MEHRIRDVWWQQRRRSATSIVAQVIWDSGQVASGVIEGGMSLRVGAPAGWSPEELLALSAGGSFMRTFLDLAQGNQLEVRGYVSTIHLEVQPDPTDGPRVTICPCVMIASADRIADARHLCGEAVRQGSITRLLGARLCVDCEIRTIAGASEPMEKS
jgi:organic hydroperoxide reductase OsmC/OhrA